VACYLGCSNLPRRESFLYPPLATRLQGLQQSYSPVKPPLIVATWRHYDFAIGAAVVGWFLHYFPFFLMKRQLFLHHYLPALYFSIIALCQSWDYLTTRSRFQSAPRRAAQITLVFLVVVAAVFTALNPIAYGGKWTKDLCQKAKVFSTWDFDCNLFYDNVPHRLHC
jgi:dolichyl-phosphate-mannose-protein mannosyltransferase